MGTFFCNLAAIRQPVAMQMTIVSTRRAKADFYKLLKHAQEGEEITITRNGEPIAKLVPVPSKTKRMPGALKHLNLQIPDSAFFDPLPDDELDAWEGKYGFDP